MYALCRDSLSGDTSLAVHRLVLLVYGTQQSKPDVVNEGSDMYTASYKITSENVQCLLSQESKQFMLVAYCNFNAMLSYRLDKDFALVFASMIDMTPDSVTVTVESMRKVNKDEVDALKLSMEIEWRSVLLPRDAENQQGFELQTSKEAAYWSEPAMKLRRMESEAHTPERARTRK